MALVQTYGKCNLGKYTINYLPFLRTILEIISLGNKHYKGLDRRTCKSGNDANMIKNHMNVTRGNGVRIVHFKLINGFLCCLSSQGLCCHRNEFFFSGKVSEEALTEEEQLNDLLLLIKLLTNLLSKDILNFGSGQWTWWTVELNNFSRCWKPAFSKYQWTYFGAQKARQRIASKVLFPNENVIGNLFKRILVFLSRFPFWLIERFTLTRRQSRFI